MSALGSVEAEMRAAARRLDGRGRWRVAVAANVHGASVFDGAADDLYEAGSVTKVFIGTLLADLAERGHLSLEDPIAALVPGASPALTMTVAEVAAHVGGIPRLPGNFRAFLRDRDDPFAAYDATALDAALATMTPERPRGRRHVYSNLGFAILGRILALRGGASVGELVRRRICEPLALEDTALGLDDDRRARLLDGHTWRGRPARPWSFDVFDAAGALTSTSRDLIRFVRAQTDPDGPLARAFARARTETWRGRSFGLGLAWFRSPLDGDVEVWHTGATNRFASYAGFVPSRQVGVVVLVNRGLSPWGALVANPVERAARRLLRACVRASA